MNNLNAENFINIVPPNFQQDPEVIAYGKAFDAMFAQVFQMADNVLVYAKIKDIIDSDLLDIIAADAHVDYYNKDWTIPKKQAACINSQQWHMKKGTAGVVKETATTFISNLELIEWWKYNGARYHFKGALEIINNAFDSFTLTDLYDAIESYKKFTATFDGVEVTSVSSGEIRLLPLTLFSNTIFHPSEVENPLIWDEGNWDEMEWCSLDAADISDLDISNM